MDAIHSKNPHQTDLNLLLVGKSGVGKTSLARRGSKLHPEGPPTRDFHKVDRLFYVDKQRVCLRFIDTPGIMFIRELPRSFFERVHAVVLVIDSTESSRDDETEKWYAYIKSIVDPDVLIFIVGTKCDLDNASPNEPSCTDKIKDLGEMLNVDWFVTSAVTGQGFPDIFKIMIRSIRQRACPAFAERSDNIITRRSSPMRSDTSPTRSGISPTRNRKWFDFDVFSCCVPCFSRHRPHERMPDTLDF